MAADGVPRVKICGLTRREDVRVAVEAGADYVGVVLSPGFGRSVEPHRAARMLEEVDVPRVAVLVDAPPDEAARRARQVGASVIQLHGSEDRARVCSLREEGDWIVWKAIRARTSGEVEAVVEALGDVVDGFLVEGWKKGVVGGGGMRLEVAPEAVRAAVPPGRTFVLAGGLTPDTVAVAVARFAPDVVDVSSGVEGSPGIKDPGLVEAFVRAARGVPRPEP